MYSHNYISINGCIINCFTLPKYIKTIEDIITYYKNNYKETYNNYYIIHNGKIINKNTTINNLFITNNNHNHIIYIDIIERQKGGGGFGDIIDAIIQIGNVFIMLYKAIKWLGLFFYWYLKFVYWIFTDFLKPTNFVSEFNNSVLIIVLAVCRIPFDILLGLMSLSVNIVGGWMQGFWGWDQSSLSEKDRNSNYFKKINKLGAKKCYLTNTNTIPFSIILGTLLCPPIGVFMDMGLTGWLNIIICTLLTLCFYIPGLLYALVIIYS